MRIYIRHSIKEYNNDYSSNRKYAHDPPLTQEGKELVHTLIPALIKAYPPSEIYTSPYLRTRETASIISEMTGISVTVKRDLSEYLGHHNKFPLDVTPETLELEPPHPENWPLFQARVRNHCATQANSDKIEWYITHGVFMSELLRQNNYKTRRPNIPFLGYIIIESEEKKPILSFTL